MKKSRNPRSKSKVSVGLIPAAGSGNRLSPKTKNLPKAMINLAGQPIIEYIVDQMIREGIKKIYIMTGKKGEIIKNYFGHGKKKNVKIHYLAVKNLKAGLGASIGHAAKRINEPFLTILGDELIITPSLNNLFRRFYQSRAFAVEMVAREKNKSVIKQTCGVILGKNHKIKKIIEKPAHPPSDISGCGIYIFDPIIAKYIKKTKPTDKGIEITNTIDLIARQGRAGAEFIRGAHVNINTPADLKKARRLLTNKI
ncbi:MAG: sugar phosphate nucleotidyltransferase [Patescibacteria group bacterium]